MLHRLCGPPSIPLSFNLAAVLPRRRTYRVSCATKGFNTPTASSHRLGRGLPGYLILFAPHAFAPQRQCWSRKPPSPLVFLRYLRISPLHREFHFPLPHSSPTVLNAIPRLSPGFHIQLIEPPTRPLRPVIPINARTLRITAAAGTELAGASSMGNVITGWVLAPCFSSPLKVLYNPRAFFTHAALLDQAFAHCPIFPTAASRRSLGRVSVPVWLIILSDQLPIVALVSHYLTNKLIGRGLI